MRDRDPAHLHPLARRIWSAHANAASMDHTVAPVVTIETHRVDETQRVDWMKGRNNAGEIIDKALVVTYKPPGDSWHNLYSWGRRCPSCKSLVESVSYACPECAAPAITVERFAAWELVPASFAWHLALGCVGCHPPGSLVGFGAHQKLRPVDLDRFGRLVRLGEGLGARSGANWDGDSILFERGETDLTHFEYHPGDMSLPAVKAVLAVRGRDITIDGGLRA